MDASTCSKLLWLLITRNGSMTETGCIDAVMAEGMPRPKAEGMVKGTLRTLEIKQLITNSPVSDGSSCYILSKRGEREFKKETKKLNAPTNGDLYEMEATLRLTMYSLAGSLPNDSQTESGKLVWPRDSGQVLLIPKWFKGMMRATFERLGTIPRYVADWMSFEPVRLSKAFESGLVRIPVPPDRPGQPGKGVNVFETLPVGTEFTVRGICPGGAIPREQLANLWSIAGRHVGFSPGKSKLGYGTFEVLDCRYGADVSLETAQSGDTDNVAAD